MRIVSKEVTWPLSLGSGRKFFTVGGCGLRFFSEAVCFEAYKSLQPLRGEIVGSASM